MNRNLLNALPGQLTSVLRRVRTTFLWALGPLDALNRLRGGRSHLPPLWLRRHVGDPRAFESSARELLSFLEERRLLPREGVILDIGCGPGSLALPLRLLLGSNARYVGFDVHAPSLQWATRAFRDNPRFVFHLATLRSPYGRPAGGAVESYAFPIADGEADLALAKSVFTHLLPKETLRYLKEIRRSIQPRGRAVITAFLFDTKVKPPLFPFSSADGLIRWRVKSRPHAAVAYERGFFDSMLAESRLETVEFLAGFWPGNGSHLDGQDTLVLTSK